MKQLIFKHDDLWTKLKKTDKPILLYGMGDGADKVMNVCNSEGIKISGVFASDGFVRKKNFRGFDITSFSDALNNHSNPIVLLCFASNLNGVMSNVKMIASKYELYCPDVPVFGDGLFDKEFVLNNIDKFNQIYEMLSDERSKVNYVNLILGKMTGDINFLLKAETSVDEAYTNIIMPSACGHYLDIGAYNGDTIKEYLSFARGYKSITAFEPDVRNFKKLCAFADEFGIPTDNFYNIAAWNQKEMLTFYSRSGRNSANTTSHKNLKSVSINADKVDSYINCKVDFINIDAEGADMKVLEGLESTIHKYRPCISCAVYHRNEDMFAIPLKLKEMYGDCKMYIRHFPYFPAWDTNIYVKPY